MSILSPKEVAALIQSTKIDTAEDKLITKQNPESINKVEVTSDTKLAQTSKTKLELIQFEKKYPALELVLTRFLDFFGNIVEDWLDAKGTITYRRVEEGKIKKIFADENSKKDYFLGYYQLQPVKSFLTIVFDIPFLENLFIAKMEADVFTKYKSKELKKKYQGMLEDLFAKLENSWNQSWRYIYPLQTKFNHSLKFSDLLQTKLKSSKVIEFYFELEILGAKYPLFVMFDEKLLNHLSKTKVAISSFLPNKVKRKMFLEKLTKKKIKVSSSLGSYSITLQELLGLEKGDIILTKFKKGDAVFFSIEEEVKFIGKFFPYRQKKAMRLIKSI